MKKIGLNTIIIILLILLNGTVVWKYFEMKKKDKFRQELLASHDLLYELDNIKIPVNTQLLPLTNGLEANLTNQLRKSDKTLVVLFEPTRCGSCLEEKQLWNEIYEKKICPIVVVSAEKNKDELLAYLKESDTRVPVYQDTSAILGKWLHPHDVPVKLLVNSKHEVLYIDYVRTSSEDRRKFLKLLPDLLNNK